MVNLRELTDKQKVALDKLDLTPRTAAELGVAAATLTSLVKKGLIACFTGKPNKYAKFDRLEPSAGGVVMTTVDGKQFEFNVYTEDKETLIDIHWSDLNGNPHSGRLLRCREGDEGCYIRSAEFKGVIYLPFTEIAIITNMEGPNHTYKKTIFNHGDKQLTL